MAKAREKLKSLFQRQVGGTKLGNTLRGIAHSIDPRLGNGLFMIKEGQTREVANSNAAKVAGETIEAFDHSQNKYIGTMETAGTQARIKRYLGWGLAILVLVGAWWYSKRNKK